MWCIFLPPQICFCKSKRSRYAELDREQHIKNSWQFNCYRNRDHSFTETTLGFYGKGKDYNAKGISLISDMISKFPTVRMLGIGFQTWCLNFTTIQRWISPRSSFLWDKFGGLREKERVLRWEKRKTKMRWRRSTWLNITIYT